MGGWLCGMAKGAALGTNRTAWITIIGISLAVVMNYWMNDRISWGAKLGDTIYDDGKKS